MRMRLKSDVRFYTIRHSNVYFENKHFQLKSQFKVLQYHEPGTVGKVDFPIHVLKTCTNSQII